MTQAIATFGVYGQPSDDERAVLDLADEYRRELCLLYQQQHNETVDLRDKLYPGLFAAMVESERLYAEIHDLEKAIKAEHSEARDRNAISDEQREHLESLRLARKQAQAEIVSQKKPWLAMLKEFRAVLREAADWKNVKSLAKRRVAYASLAWPAHLADYAEMWLRIDLDRRELGERYQAAGLHSAIRAEIVEASQPKLGKDKPGIRYRYGHQPNPRPWEKLPLHIPGGLTLADAIAGQSRSLRLTAIYANHPAGGMETVYEVRQQIGTADWPRMIAYRMKLDKEVPLSAQINRWSLVVRGRKRFVVPTATAMDFSKPIGKGLLTYDLTWTVRKSGVQVCEFVGEHVHERLILPTWLVEKRMAVSAAQTACDNAANEFLEQRGIARSKSPGSLHGVEALADFCGMHPQDNAAANKLYDFQRRLKRAHKDAASAIGCIEKIYETVAKRVCCLHSELAADPLNLAKVKRYDKRDLLREDVLPKPSRELLHAVAPGKLSALLKRYGLASAEVPEGFPGTARSKPTTDVFTSWIASIGVKTGTKPAGACHRSQLTEKAAVV